MTVVIARSDGGTVVGQKTVTKTLDAGRAATIKLRALHRQREVGHLRAAGDEADA